MRPVILSSYSHVVRYANFSLYSSDTYTTTQYPPCLSFAESTTPSTRVSVRREWSACVENTPETSSHMEMHILQNLHVKATVDVLRLAVRRSSALQCSTFPLATHISRESDGELFELRASVCDVEHVGHVVVEVSENDWE